MYAIYIFSIINRFTANTDVIVLPRSRRIEIYKEFNLVSLSLFEVHSYNVEKFVQI